MTFSKYGSIFLLMCLLCTACYESKYPLASPQNPVDKRLLRSWVEQQPSAGTAQGKPFRVSIFQFNEKEYTVIFSSDNESASVARGYATVLDGTQVLNLQGIESQNPKDRTFVFFKYAFTPDSRLQTWMISRDSPLLKNKSFSSAAAFAAYIKKHIHEQSLFDPVRVFTPAESLTVGLSR